MAAERPVGRAHVPGRNRLLQHEASAEHLAHRAVVQGLRRRPHLAPGSRRSSPRCSRSPSCCGGRAGASASRSRSSRGLVLSSMFAFFYVHAGRTANTDAINTLLIVLTVVTVSEAREDGGGCSARRRHRGGVPAARHGRHHARGDCSRHGLEPAVAAGPPVPGRLRRSSCVRCRSPRGCGAMADRRLAVSRTPVLVRLRRAHDNQHRRPSGFSVSTTSTSCRSITTTGWSPRRGVAALPGASRAIPSDGRVASHGGGPDPGAGRVGRRRLRHPHADDHQDRVVPASLLPGVRRRRGRHSGPCRGRGDGRAPPGGGGLR